MRLIFYLVLAFNPYRANLGEARPHLKAEAPTPTVQTEEYTAVPDRRCFIFVNADGDVAERCP